METTCLELNGFYGRGNCQLSDHGAASIGVRVPSELGGEGDLVARKNYAMPEYVIPEIQAKCMKNNNVS